MEQQKVVVSPSKDAIRRSRRVFTPEEKATILRRHLADKSPAWDLCDEYQLALSLFCLWLNSLRVAAIAAQGATPSAFRAAYRR